MNGAAQDACAKPSNTKKRRKNKKGRWSLLFYTMQYSAFYVLSSLIFIFILRGGNESYERFNSSIKVVQRMRINSGIWIYLSNPFHWVTLPTSRFPAMVCYSLILEHVLLFFVCFYIIVSIISTWQSLFTHCKRFLLMWRFP